MSTSVVSGGNPLLNTGGNPLTSQGYSNSGNSSLSNNCNIMLIMLNSSSKKQKIVNLEKPMHLGRAVDNTPASSNTAIHNSSGMQVSSSNPQFIYYNSKVVSRNHAILKYENGKFYIKDTGSSSGTFLNGKRLSPQGQESTFHELSNGDIIKLGEDCQVNKILHKCVLLKVITTNVGSDSSALDDIDYLDITMDPEVRTSVQSEFDVIWKSLTEGVEPPREYLSYLKRTLLSDGGETDLHHHGKLYNNSFDTYEGGSMHGSKSSLNIVANNFNNPAISSTNTSNPSTMKIVSKKSIENALNELEDLITDNQTKHKRQLSRNENNNNPIGLVNSTKSVPSDQIQSCISFITSNNWKSHEIQQTLVNLAQSGDRQLLSYYENLKQFPQVFINISTKYVEDHNYK